VVHIAGEVVESALVVVLVEPLDGAGMVEVEVSGAAGDVELVVIDTVLGAGLLADWETVVVDVAICAGVEVDDTNGGAFSIYEPDGWTA
jgi:hypothetical protein